MLWHHSKVGKNTVLRNCIVCSHSYVEQDSHIHDSCVLGEGVTVPSGNILAKGEKVWPDGFDEKGAS